jgi:hypothetical protein
MGAGRRGNAPPINSSLEEVYTIMMGRTAISIVASMLALSASFIVAIIVTILVTREMELPQTETGGQQT